MQLLIMTFEVIESKYFPKLTSEFLFQRKFISVEGRILAQFKLLLNLINPII